MFAALRLSLCGLALAFYSAAAFCSPTPKPGTIAEQQIRYITSHFPGRITGSPTEQLTADYLQQQFHSWGYESDIRQFNARYRYTPANGEPIWQNVTGNSVIAVHPGKAPQQIIIMAHLDTWIPLSDSDSNRNLGGLSLQGVDDNASGLGVMLELAERLRKVPTHYSLRFIATSGKQIEAAGARSVLQRMSKEDQKNTLLVINLDSLIVGERLTFTSSASTPKAVRKLSRDRAIALANQLAIPAITRLDTQTQATSGQDFYREVALFDKAGIPVLSVESGRNSGAERPEQQRAISNAFPEGSVRHQTALDNTQYLDKWLPGQIKRRTRDVVQIMLPLVKGLVKVEK